jgi:L-threonylcarbamoyladenylate synthase
VSVVDASIGRAVEALRDGRVIAVPTDTVYGLAVDPRVPGATEALFRMKGRPEATALPVLVGSYHDAETLGVFDRRGIALVERYWPGALTIVVARLPAVSFDLGDDRATIGLRHPAHALISELLVAAGPLAVTSANRHGEAPLTTAEDVAAAFGQPGRALTADLLVVDGGLCRGRPSTVVALTGPEPIVLREGAIGAPELFRLLGELDAPRP